jgi:hypothetical protein
VIGEKTKAEKLFYCLRPEELIFGLSLTLFLTMASAACMVSAFMAFAVFVAASITHLVSVEVIEGPLSTLRMWTNVAVMRIEAIINVAAEVVGAVEPRAGSDEHAAGEPLGTIVPIWGAVVWGEVVVAIRASRLYSDIDGNLGGCRARDDQQSGNQGGKGKDFPIAHKFLLTLEKCNPDAKIVMTGRD